MPAMRCTRLLLLLGCLCLWSTPARVAADVDYLRQIKPILAARCFACHGALQQKNGLRLDTVELMKKGGDAGPALVPGRADASLLVERVTGVGVRMPPLSEGDGLKEAEVALLRTWIDQGAAAPTDEKPEADPRDHWAFKPPVRPQPPANRKPQTANRNPVDAFLAAEHARRGLTPQPPADRRLLLRRVSLDLIGLP